MLGHWIPGKRKVRPLGYFLKLLIDIIYGTIIITGNFISNVIDNTEFIVTISYLPAESLCNTFQPLTSTIFQMTDGRPPSREKAWRTFHRLVTERPGLIDRVAEIIGDEKLSAYFSLRLFKHLIDAKFKDTNVSLLPDQTPSCPEHQSIVFHIGGSTIKKLQKVAFKRKDGEGVLETLSVLVSEDEYEGLTKTLDRGGLIYLKPQAQYMFLQVEGCFCKYSEGKTVLLVSDFVSLCLRNDEIVCSFYEMVENCQAAENEKNDVLFDILKLFFKIRAYQKCKVAIDGLFQKEKRARKQRPLRKTLKDL